jgi:HEAT repeat protein
MTAATGPSGSARRRRKQRLEELLRRRDLAALRALEQQGRARLASGLVGFLNEPDDLLRWRAIEALGLLAGQVAGDDLDRVRDWVRRQFWMMTEESGGIPWHAPEAIGEMLYRTPLAPEFTSQLMGHHDEFPFQGGCYWAMARLAPAHPQLVSRELPELLQGLTSELPAVRGHAARALGQLRAAAAVEQLEPLKDDPSPVLLYDFGTGELTAPPVANLARQALEVIS